MEKHLLKMKNYIIWKIHKVSGDLINDLVCHSQVSVKLKNYIVWHPSSFRQVEKLHHLAFLKLQSSWKTCPDPGLLLRVPHRVKTDCRGGQSGPTGGKRGSARWGGGSKYLFKYWPLDPPPRSKSHKFQRSWTTTSFNTPHVSVKLRNYLTIPKIQLQ